MNDEEETGDDIARREEERNMLENAWREFCRAMNKHKNPPENATVEMIAQIRKDLGI